MLLLNVKSRRQFLKWLCAGLVCAPGLPLWSAGNDQLRGDRVGWARLKTSSPSWLRHADGDPTLMRFFRGQTTLNIDPTWYVADVQKLDEMIKYPFLFAQSLVEVKDSNGKTNLVEFLQRSGFMLVDACCNLKINPEHDVFLERHLEYLKEILPAAKVATLPVSHPVYNCRFQIPDGHPPHTFHGNVFDARKARHGLYGVMLGNRMAGMITLCGLQCGWRPRALSQWPGHDVACMKMLTNIYVYAMAQGA